MAERSIIPVERIEKRIYLIRGQKVMLDSDLAALYGVVTGRLNEAVKRNVTASLKTLCSNSRRRRRNV